MSTRAPPRSLSGRVIQPNRGVERRGHQVTLQPAPCVRIAEPGPLLPVACHAGSGPMTWPEIRRRPVPLPSRARRMPIMK